MMSIRKKSAKSQLGQLCVGAIIVVGALPSAFAGPDSYTESSYEIPVNRLHFTVDLKCTETSLATEKKETHRVITHFLEFTLSNQGVSSVNLAGPGLIYPLRVSLNRTYSTNIGDEIYELVFIRNIPREFKIFYGGVLAPMGIMDKIEIRAKPNGDFELGRYSPSSYESLKNTPTEITMEYLIEGGTLFEPFKVNLTQKCALVFKSNSTPSFESNSSHL